MVTAYSFSRAQTRSSKGMKPGTPLVHFPDSRGADGLLVSGSSSRHRPHVGRGSIYRRNWENT